MHVAGHHKHMSVLFVHTYRCAIITTGRDFQRRGLFTTLERASHNTFLSKNPVELFEIDYEKQLDSKTDALSVYYYVQSSFPLVTL